MSRIQSVLFDRRYFNERTARTWLIRHKFIVSKVDITPNYLRYRQIVPLPYKNIE